MKSSNFIKKQTGFFDLGLSLMILALSGIAAYSIESAQVSKIEAAESFEAVAIGKTDPQTAGPVGNLN